MRSSSRRTATVLSCILSLAGMSVEAAVGAVPDSVSRAQSATVTVQASQINAVRKAHHGVAFAVTRDGTYLTASSVVLRHGRLAIRTASGKLVTAKRVFSTAPTGTQMLRAPAATPAALAAGSSRIKKGDRLWAASPQPQTRCAVLKGSEPIRVTRVTEAGTATLSAPASCFAETVGTPLVDRQGQVRAVVVAGVSTSALAVGLRSMPKETVPFAINPSSDAVPVPLVVAIVGALLLLSTFLFARRRRATAQSSSPVPVVAMDPSAGGSSSLPVDDTPLDISLKPKSKPVASAPVEGIELRRP